MKLRGPLRYLERRWVQTGLLAALCFLVGYALTSVFLFPGSTGSDDRRLVEVPDLLGFSQEQAAETLVDVGLEPEMRARIRHPEAAEGSVVAQSPLAGQLARPGERVSVTLSAGADVRRVPDLQGVSPRQAVVVLERMGFRVRTRAVADAGLHGGVQGTVPPAGAAVTVPAEVELLVAEGPQVVQVPNLRGRHIDDVESLLEQAGLRLGSVRFAPESSEAPGRVVAQSPPAGYSLRGGGDVSVDVAGSPEEAGGSENSAPSMVEAAGASAGPEAPVAED